jgi:hypothetical protein
MERCPDCREFYPGRLPHICAAIAATLPRATPAFESENQVTEQTNERANSERVALAREMFVMLKEHTRAASVSGMVPSQLNAHEVHELADGAARLIAATAPNAAPPRIGGKREGT